jgi:type VII secretion-associated serine protease mycosin
MARGRGAASRGRGSTLACGLAAVAACAAATLTALPSTPAHADSIRDSQWHLGTLDIAKAQQISQGEGITVAVIDSGVADHPDLAGNVLAGTDLVPHGTGDGRADSDGHGTAMAGLIAAHGHGPGGAQGALGIAPKAKILPIRDIAEDHGFGESAAPGEADDQATAKAIRYAVAHGAKIINISQIALGDFIEAGQAVKEAQDHGVLVFAAAGNVSALDSKVIHPANFNWVVAVGGTDRDGTQSDDSVTGSEVELAAPGVDVVSTGLNGSSHQGTGTSDSTAIVSGVAALVWSTYPDLSAREVLYRLEATATDKDTPGRDPRFGFGIVDPVAALTADLPPLPAPGPAASGSPATTTTGTPAAGTRPPVTAAAASGDDGGGVSPTSLALAGAGVVALVAAVVLGRRAATSRGSGAPAGLVLLGVAAVGLIAVGAYVAATGGGGGGDGGGGPSFGEEATKTPKDVVRTYIKAVQANDCEHALDLVTQTSWSSFGTISRKAALSRCAADAHGVLNFGIANIRVATDLGGDQEMVGVMLEKPEGRDEILVPVAKQEGKWLIDYHSPAAGGDEQAGAYLGGVDVDVPPPTQAPTGDTIDTRIRIPAENQTPDSCLTAKDTAGFATCYDDMAAHIFVT